MNNHYLYRHIRDDKNQPFYIGIGSHYGKSTNKTNYYGRAYTKCGRNNIWHKITNKTTYRVEILIDNLTKEQACNKEIEFIKLYGRVDKQTGTLSNLTDGGEINKGRIVTDIQKIKISQSALNMSKEKRENINNAIRLGYKNGTRTLPPGAIMTSELKEKLKKGRQQCFLDGRNKTAKKVLDTKTGIIYNSCNEAAREHNIKKLSCKLAGTRYNTTSFIYLEDYITNGSFT